jgi:hypothetical protein
MTAPLISALPTAPSRTDSPAVFSALADAFVAALPTFRSETNTLATYLEGITGSAGPVTATALTMATAKILGRTTASTGAIEEITVGTGLTLAGGTLSASGSTYTDEQARDAIGAALVAGTGISVTVNDGADTITIAATGSGSSVSSQTGTAYTAVLGDANTYIQFSNASAISFTIPQNSSVAFPIGTVIEMEQAGAGALTVVAGTGTTINSRGADLTLAGQYAVAALKKVATNTWTLTGDL